MKNTNHFKKMRGPGKGKSNNPAGKPKGAQNKSSKELKEFLLVVLSGQAENINDSLTKLKAESEAKYIHALTNLLPFVVAKQTDITTGGESINTTQIIVSNESIKKQLDQID